MGTSNEVKRTQGEWKFEDNLNHSIYIEDGNKYNKGKVYITGYTSGEANAAFICEAVNNYDKLKEDNAFLLKNIERLKVCAKKVLQYPKGSQGYDPIDAINLEDAIKKAQ